MQVPGRAIPINQLVAYRCYNILFDSLFAPNELTRAHAAEIIIQEMEAGNERNATDSFYASLDHVYAEYAKAVARQIAYHSSQISRIPAARALYRAGEKEILQQVILKALDSNDLIDRITAVEALGRLQYLAAKPIFEREIKSTDSLMRIHALAALAHIGDPAAVPLLLAALKSDDADTRAIASWACGNIREKSAAPLLEELRYDSNPRVAFFAHRALARMGVRDTLPFLRSALFHQNDTELRYLAADAIGYFTDMSSIEVLSLAFHDPEPDVRLFAASSLLKIAKQMPQSFTQKHLDLITDIPWK